MKVVRARASPVPWSPGPALPWSSGFLVPCFFGPAVFQLLLRLCFGPWFLWPPGLRVRWSPGHPIPVPLVFWFSSPAVFWSPDAPVWSPTRFVSQCPGLLVLFSSCFLVLGYDEPELQLGFYGLCVSCSCFWLFSKFQLVFAKWGGCLECMMNRNRQMRVRV